MADRLEKTCPKCGSHLMMREGEYGDFLACPKFPACRYTEPLPDGAWDEHNTLTLKMRQPHNPYCEACNHTGLIPFEKNGKIIPNAWIDCECKQPEVEHYRDIRPDDFDFPMSKSSRGFSYQYCGVVDPAESPKSITVEERVVIPLKTEVIYRYLKPICIEKKKSKDYY